MHDAEQIRAELGKAQEGYLKARAGERPESEWRPLSDKVVALRKDLSAALADGSEPCTDCDSIPVGLRHMSVNARTRKTTFTYEVGCPVCQDHRAIGDTRETAVAAWNEREYLPPKEAPPSDSIG